MRSRRGIAGANPIGGRLTGPEYGKIPAADRNFVTRGLQVPRATARGVSSQRGELAEWSKASHSKCEVPATVPRVRIPHSPPFSFPCGWKTPVFDRLAIIIPAFGPTKVSGLGLSPATWKYLTPRRAGMTIAAIRESRRLHSPDRRACRHRRSISARPSRQAACRDAANARRRTRVRDGMGGGTDS